VIVIIGDATDNFHLEQARVSHASKLVTFTDQDKKNLAITQTAFDLKHKTQNRDQPLECLVHIYDDGLRKLFVRHPLFANSDEYFDARMFSIYEKGAKKLLLKHFSEHKLDVTEPKPGGSSHHILLVGFGWIGKNIALQASRIGCYPDDRKLKITVLDKNAKYLAAKLGLEMPAILQLIDIQFFEVDSDLLPASFDKLHLHQRYVPGDAEQNINHTNIPLPDITYVSLGDELLNYTTAQELSKWFAAISKPSEIVVCLSDNLGISRLIEKAKIQTGNVKIVPVEILKHTLVFRSIFNLELEKLAQTIHYDYVCSQLETINPEKLAHFDGSKKSNKDELLNSLPLLINDIRNGKWSDSFKLRLVPFRKILGNDSILSWEEMSPELKDANREQAEHIEIKLGVIGCQAKNQKQIL